MSVPSSLLPSRGRRWWVVLGVAVVLAGVVGCWWLSGIRPEWIVDRGASVAAIFAAVGTGVAALVGVVVRLGRSAEGSYRPGRVRMVGQVPPPAAWWQSRLTGLEVIWVSGRGSAAVPRALVLVGMGGVGKTQLAAALARRQVERSKVDLLLWIMATRADAIVTGYAEAARRLGLAGVEHDAPRAAALFRSWLQTTDQRWLVVIDDLVSPSDLSSWWPPTTSRGRVLVTTRRRDAALLGEGRMMHEVGLFTSREARDYLIRALPGPQPVDEIDRLAAELGYLPLALSQTVAYMRDRGLSCAQYRERLLDRQRRLSDLLPERDALPDAQQATVAATWSLSVDLADQLRPEHLARPVLDLGSVLDPNGIPWEVFTTTAVRAYLAAATGGEVTSVDAQDALCSLHRLHLVSIDRDPASESTRRVGARVHALVQRATRDQLTDAALRRVAHAAADALLEIWPDPETDQASCSALRANAAALYDHAGDALLIPEAHRVLFRAGESLGDTGQVTAAIEHFQQVLADCQRVLGPEHPRTLSARHNLAHWRGHGGDTAGAVTAFEALVADRIRVLGPDHPDSLRARGGLADWQGYAGDTAGAVTAFEALVADRTRVLGPDHPDTLYARGSLARWQGLAGDAGGAVAALRTLLPQLLRVLGPEHPDTLRARNNLAHLLGEAGDTTHAVAAFEVLVRDRVRVLGPDHRDTLRARCSLAYWLAQSGEVDRAVSMLRALIPDLVRVLGPDHPGTIRALNLASMRGQVATTPDTVEVLEALVPQLARVGGLDHSRLHG